MSGRLDLGSPGTNKLTQKRKDAKKEIWATRMQVFASPIPRFAVFCFFAPLRELWMQYSRGLRPVTRHGLTLEVILLSPRSPNWLIGSVRTRGGVLHAHGRAIVVAWGIVLLATFLPAFICAQTNEEAPRAFFGPAIAIDVPQPAAPPAAKNPVPQESGPGTLFYPLQLTPPNAGRLFVMESEEVFRERLRREARDRGVREPLEFPGSTVPHRGRQGPYDWHGYTRLVEPSYVLSHRLMWEQKPFERYGVSLGVIQPAVSTGLFVIDTLAWPARRAMHPLWWNEVNTDGYSPYFYLIGEQGRQPWRKW